MYKLIVNKMMLSTIIFILVVTLCACGNDINVTNQELVLEEKYEELASADEAPDLKDFFMEDVHQGETGIPQDNKGGKTKEILTEERFVNEFAELMGTDFYEYYEKFS